MFDMMLLIVINAMFTMNPTNLVIALLKGGNVAKLLTGPRF